MIEKFIEKYGKDKLEEVLSVLLAEDECDDDQCDDESCVLTKAFNKYLYYTA